MKPQSLPWTDPMALAASVEEDQWVLLYSGVQTHYSGRYSYLAHHLAESVEGDNFDALARVLSDDKGCMENAWFGYLGYGLKDRLETLPADTSYLSYPKLCMMRFKSIYRFDHHTQTLTRWSDGDIPLLKATTPKSLIYPLAVSELSSNMDKDCYLNHVKTVIQHIHQGDLYQANLTRKFTGKFENIPDSFSLFAQLCSLSPAPYSAYIRNKDTAILSSSPELFLQVDAQGNMRSRPIKGTSARHDDPKHDIQSRQTLETSTKDRAENLMIVDLMRNDFSRACKAGSVETSALYEVTTHANVHHMSGTISGKKRGDVSTLDAVKYCFPPGSMTGAPKIRAMELCTSLEELERGIYSGAIGWFGGDGSCELSVVIRTLVMEGTQFEFQVGGGIVADSIPEQEFQETRDKARGILAALGLSIDVIR